MTKPAQRNPLSVFVLLLAAFTVGVFVERSGWLPGRKDRQPAGTEKTFAPFWQSWNYVHEYYVDREKVKDERLTRAAIDGMINSLGDVGHTAYMTPEEVKEMEDSLKGEMEGIGARVQFRKQYSTVMQTLPGSPARKAGLKRGDRVVSVEGKSVLGLSLRQVVARVRGPADTTVKLTVLREGVEKPMEFSITRAKVSVPEVSWRKLPGAPIAHLAILEFGEKTHELLVQALKEIHKQEIRGVIVDVRGNTGGLKNQAIAVTSEFLEEGQTVFIEVNARGQREEIPAMEGGAAKDLPVVVLIDGGTASSAEIFAGALQDHGKAKLVGTRTFGTGTVLRRFPLEDGSALLLAVAKWLTPKGRQIWHQGIEPDIKVTLPKDAMILLPDSPPKLTEKVLQESDDKQLLRAITVLKDQLKGQ